MVERPAIAAAANDPSATIRFDRKLILRSTLGLALLLGVAFVCGTIFREPIITAGRAAIERFGLIGLAAGTIFTDSSPLPLTNEPLVILALSGGVSPWVIFFVVSAASISAGIVGYTGGLLAGTRTPLGPWIKRRYPGFAAFMQRYGATGVAICAFFPIPFAISTWSAGMTRIGLHRVALASLVRIPKTAFYVWLILMGWAGGA